MNLPDTIRPAHVAPLTLGAALSGLADVPASLASETICDLAYDSRRVSPSCLYFGLPGAKAHGASFGDQAQAAGAVAMVTDAEGAKLATGSLPVLAVADPRQMMALVAARVFGDPTAGRLTFGVTGTMGKTTTCLMLDAALRAQGRHVGYIGTIGFTVDGEPIPVRRNTVTTPESVDLQAALAAMAEMGADTFVMEASSMGLALHRVTGVHFDVVGFTNLARDHLDFHGTMEAYYDAKAELFRPGWAGQAVVNVDDEAGQRLAAGIAAAGQPTLTTVGRGATADYQILDRVVEGRRQLVAYRHDGDVARFGLDMPGQFNVSNAMLALGMMQAAGFAAEPTRQGLSHAVVPGRMQPVDLGPDAPAVFIDFGHTPEATEAALSAAPRPSVAVLGAGGDRDPGKRELMGAAAARQTDVVIVTDDNYRSEDPALIRAAVRRGAEQQATLSGANVIEVAGRPQAVREALAMAPSSWCVVVLGRGVEEFQEIAGGQRIPMRDADLVRQAWHEIKRERS